LGFNYSVMHRVSNVSDINASWQNSTDTDLGKTGTDDFKWTR